MKYFTIMIDDIAHTAVYLIRASTKKEALEKFSIAETGAEKLEDGSFIVHDYGDSKYDEYYKTIDELVEGHWRKSSQRFEVLEIDLDLTKDVQGIFCSKEKPIQ
jgi:hypothetical protein